MTRKEYLNCAGTPESHREYYAQFVDQRVLNLVKVGVGAKRIKASSDPHLNDIPLGTWDRLLVPVPREVAEAVESQGDYPTLAGMAKP